jgi:trigger factor
LNIETQTRDDHQVQIKVQIPDDRLEKAKRHAARHISEHSKIPGFRPGKAPYDMVLRFVGEERIYQEAVEHLVNEIYPEALKESKIEPATQGSLEDVSKELPLSFTFLVPLQPTVDLGNYKTIRHAYASPTISEKDVDDAIERIRRSSATVEPLDQPAAEGNLVYLTYSGTLIKADPNEDPLVWKDRSLEVKIDSKEEERESEYPFKGFSRKLIDAKEGDEKSFSYTYKKDYPDEKLKGKSIDFAVKIQSVKTLKLPELNEQFLQGLGQFESVDAFRATIRTQLESEATSSYDNEYFNNVVDLLREGASIKYPPQLLEDEKDDLRKSVERNLASQKLDLETYLKLRKSTREEFEDQEIIPSAKNRLERSLVINEFSKQEKIELPENEMQEMFNQTLNDLARTEDISQLQKKLSKRQLTNAIAMEAANRLMNKHLFKALKTIANNEKTLESVTDSVSEKPVKKNRKEKTVKSD